MRGSWRVTAGTVFGAVRAGLGSGVVGLVGPRTAARMVRAVARYGPSPATLVAVAAARTPDRLAIVDETGGLSYAQLQAQCESISAALYAASGRTAPRSVGVLCRNHRGFVQALVVGLQLGSEVVLVNTELPEQQLGHILQRHRPEVLIADSEYLPALAAVGFAGKIVVSDVEQADGEWANGEWSNKAQTLAGLARAGGERPPRTRRPSRITMLTSGTTGLAKGVPKSVSPLGVLGVAVSGLNVLRLRAGDGMLVAPPFFHGFGMLGAIASLAVGGTLVCAKKFDGAWALEAVERHKVAVFFGVPVMFQRLLAAAGPAPRRTSLRLALTGAAPMPTHVIEEFTRVFGNILVNGYGSTEVGIVSLAAPRDIAESPSTVGRPVLGVKVRVLGEDRAPLAPGETGTVFVKGGLATAAYTDDPVKNPTAKEVVGGYISTGDMGHFDSGGRLYVDGRSDDMVVSGGENVFPGEVEEALGAHPALVDVVVRGIADQEYGQVLRAYLVVAPGAEPPEPEELKAHVKNRLERYKVPKEFVFLPEIPRNPSGKVVLPHD
ncbi:MAG: AMP-binding protein [Segniliparus sp.]|uniref:AMP-binding protein n=1 Tax=Segniliparus sp. TaxID=2804064 RepID=UPI003F2BDDF5